MVYRHRDLEQAVPSKIYKWQDGIDCPACGYNKSNSFNVLYQPPSGGWPSRINKLCDRCGFYWSEETAEAKDKRKSYRTLGCVSIFLAFVVFSCILFGFAII